MAEKIINSRVVHKHDTEANWNKAKTFVPKGGEFIVYDTDATYWYPRLKIGDGVTTVIDLPFVDEAIYAALASKAQVVIKTWEDGD